MARALSSRSTWASLGSDAPVTVAYVRLQTSVTRLVAALRRSTTSFFRASLTEVGVTHSEAASLAVRDAFFFDDPSLLRGTRLAQLLHGFGKVLEDSQGSAATYELSHTVTRLDWFISHNWSVGRWEKFMALQLHFHGCRALVAAALAWCLAFGLTVAGYIPVVEDRDGRFAVSSFLVVLPTFAAYVCFAPEVARCMGLSGPSVFLDKTCIHQTDVERKRQGILKLGAFLRKSNGMVIIYGDVYLRKLWTVYEVACFLFVKPREPIFLVPLYLHKFAIWGCLTSFVLNCVLYMMRLNGVVKDPDTIFMVGLLRFLAVAFFFRRLAHELKRIQALVQNFSVQDTMCFDESDRPLVYHNIVMFMEVAGLVEAGEPEPAALEKFDGLVRGHLGNALRLSIGSAGLPYHLAVAYFLNHFSYNVDIELGRLSRQPASGAAAAAYLVWFLGFVLAIGPLALVLFCAFLRRLHKLHQGLAAALFIAGTVTTTTVLYFCYSRVLYRWVVLRAADCPLFFALLVSIFVLLLALTYRIYRPLPCGARVGSCSGMAASVPSTSRLPAGCSSWDLAQRTLQAARAAAAASASPREGAPEGEEMALSPEAGVLGAGASSGLGGCELEGERPDGVEAGMLGAGASSGLGGCELEGERPDGVEVRIPSEDFAAVAVQSSSEEVETAERAASKDFAEVAARLSSEEMQLAIDRHLDEAV